MPIKSATTAPFIKITSQKLAHDTGTRATDLITTDGHVTLTGTLAASSGTTVQIYDGATLVGSAKLDGKGGWTFSTTLPSGSHTLHAVAVGPSGLTATTAPEPTIVVDTSMPTVSFRYETQVVGTNTVSLYGTVIGSAGTTVEVFSGKKDLGAAIVTGTTWHFTTAALKAGNYSFAAVATTLAGNTSTFGKVPSLTVGPATGTLNPAHYTKVWEQDFTKTSSIDANIFPIAYGHDDQFNWGANGLTLTSNRSEGFSNVGFLQANWQASLSQGYGLYSVTASHPANQGGGIAILLWPANNVWPGPELDMVEDWTDPTSQSATMSVHFKGPNGQDMANAITLHVDLTKMNTFALDWEAGSLAYFLNGQELFQITGTEVPKDAAHGGINAAFGAQITDIGTSYEPTDQVALTIADMSYSVMNALAPATPRHASVADGAHTVSAGMHDLVSILTAGAASYDQLPAAASVTDALLGPALAASNGN